MMERVQEIFYLETFDIKNRMKDSPDMMIGVDSGRLLCKLNKICGNSKKRICIKSFSVGCFSIECGSKR